MKSSKLIDIFKQGNIVIPLYFIQHYKELNLDLNEFIFLMYLYNLGDKFVFNPMKFSKDLNIDFSCVMNYIDKLCEKHLIKIESEKNEKGIIEEFLNLAEFFNRVSFLAIGECNKEEEQKSKSDYGVIDVIEKEFGRTISPIEYEIIKAWIDGGTSEEIIKEAIKEATLNGVSNLRYIDKIIYEWGKLGLKTAEDVEKNKKKRNKNQEQSIDDLDLDVIDWDWFDDE